MRPTPDARRPTPARAVDHAAHAVDSLHAVDRVALGVDEQDVARGVDAGRDFGQAQVAGRGFRSRCERY